MSEIKAMITTAEMTAKLSQGADANVKPPSLRSLRVEAEVEAIRRTLEYTGWNRRRAAQLLSISYRGILYKIRQHNLTPCPRVTAESTGPMLKADSQG
jgi:two-component system, NtrC family, response regulator AtoC